MVLSAIGTLSDRRIADALAWQENDERYRTLVRNRIQRRRGGDRVQRSYSCEDLSLFSCEATKEGSRVDPLESSMSGYRRTCSSAERRRKSSVGSRAESPARYDTGERDVRHSKEAEKTKKSGNLKSQRSKKNTKAKREKKNRIRRHTKTVSFPANSLLHYAVLENDIDLIGRLCQGDSVNLNVLSKEGTAPLHEAAINGSTECVNILLKNGASVNVLDADGYTPLEYAVYAGQFDCASLLIEMGANVSKIRDGFNLPLAR